MHLPFLDSGATIIEAVKVLFEHGVKEENIIFLNLFATPHGKCNTDDCKYTSSLSICD